MKDLYDELNLIGKIAAIPSSICLIIHFYKFFRAGNISAQRLATKNLTFYCFLLLLNNISFFGGRNTSERLPNWLYFFVSECGTYTEYSLTSFKLIIALDICLCFRKIALYLQSPPASCKHKKFYIYCFLGTSVPSFHLLLTRLYFGSYLPDNIFFNNLFVLSTIRTCRLIPIAGAFWYIRLASIDKTELWSKFSLHMRLLMMLGGLAAFFGVIQLYLWFKRDLVDDYIQQYEVVVMIVNASRMQEVGNILEGVIIAILFTFKKDTFTPTHTST